MMGWHHRFILRLDLRPIALLLVSNVYQTYFRLRDPGTPPILVFQMGKVGSRTIEQTLLSLNLNRPVYHTHHLSKAGLKVIEDMTQARKRAYPGKAYWAGQFFRKAFELGRIKRPLHIITLTRDPIARNVSALFHALPVWDSSFWQEQLNLSASARRERLQTLLLESRLADIPSVWFDMEMKSFFGLDVFSTPFDKQRGYQIYHHQDDDIHLLIIRLENLNECLQEAFRTFLGIDWPFSIISANQAKQKDYYLLYNDFQQNVIFPAEYLDRVYNTKYARHFYTAEELQAFRKRWSGGHVSNTNALL